jgi:hypothetical protein
MGVESRVKHWVETATANYWLDLSCAGRLLSRSTSTTWSMSQKNIRGAHNKKALAKP